MDSIKTQYVCVCGTYNLALGELKEGRQKKKGHKIYKD